jgi:hypothetical protein
MMLDSATGEFHVAQQTFGPNLRERDFLASECGVSANAVHRSERHYYEMWKQAGPELEIGLTLAFIPNGPLQRISAQVVKPGIRGSEWSKAKEDDI